MIQVGKMFRLCAKNGMLVDDVDEIVLINKIVIVDVAEDYTFGYGKKA